MLEERDGITFYKNEEEHKKLSSDFCSPLVTILVCLSAVSIILLATLAHHLPFTVLPY